MGNLLRLLMVLFALLATDPAGASGDHPVNFESAADITRATCCKDFRLTDHNGQARTISDFRGKVVVMFFGFTQCPDVCPTTFLDIQAVLKKLGADAKRVQVLFVTLDPERDTPALLSQYVGSFDPSFLGLYGDTSTTAATAKEFRVFYKKQPGSTPSSYTLDHSVGSYVFDTNGKIRLFVAYGQKPERLISDIQVLLRGR